MLRVLCGLGVIVSVVGCSEPPTPEPVKITVTPSVARVRANGTNSVTITVSRTGSVDVRLVTLVGSFRDSPQPKSTIITGGSGTAELITCNSREVVCSGTVKLTATSSDNATGSAEVIFEQLELCNDGRDNDADGKLDCFDDECLGLSCALPAGYSGTGTCDASGICICTTGAAEICDDGIDNNCDGKADCLDPTCDTKICKLPTQVSGRCAGTTCKCPGVAEVCDNSIDDDCDGAIDCADSNCQSTGGVLGKICDANGRTCSPADSTGNATCSVCPGGQSAESTCSDAKDNDCDGKIDCADTDCDTKACGGFGKVCDGAAELCVCGGNGGTAEAAEATCGDAKDNDCDGVSDCADSDCVAGGGAICGANGLRCRALNSCSCGKTVEDCSTAADDDCNGEINCAQTSCRPGATGLGAQCDQSGNTCSQVINNVSTCSVCFVDGGIVEAQEGQTGGASLTCGDGKDNDCDGTSGDAGIPSTDCQDSDCDGKPCSTAGGICSIALKDCICPNGAANETGLCSDTIDNDCDGKLNCADPDCQPSATVSAGVCGANGFLCTATGLCACSGGGAPQPAGETSCGDGKDNDCDGLVDCADPQCRPVGNALGQVCDLTGNTCSNPVGGVSSCSVCSGNGGQAQTSEFACGDGKDNDCDGLIDCQDPGCDSLACSSTGKRCVASTQACTCPGSQALGETSCGDGLDNDCDGQTDCADPNCQPVSGNPAQACSTTGKFCTATGLCACNGNGGVVEATEGASTGPTCGDGKDNDCNGLADCADSSCRPVPPGSGKNCSQPTGTPATVGKLCDVSGVCVCPGGQAAEASCSDLSDNDCDGLVDCADSNCLGAACSANGKTCSSTAPTGCTCPSGLTNEATNALCSNQLDDDCDGLVDCVDPDCAGKQCNGGNSNYLCTTGPTSVCQDQTSLYSLVVTPASSRIPADGIATTVISAVLKNGSTPVVGVSVSFAVTTGPGAVAPLSAATDSTGKATTVFTAGTTGAISTITASYSGASGSTTVNQPRVGQVKFISQQFSLMGVRFSSFQETNILTFQVLDVGNATYPAGLVVAFTHAPVGGSYIGSTAACSGSPVSCTASGVTDGQGFVTVALHSGTVASVVSVRGDASAGGGTANATASNIAIVGAKASGLHASLDCTPKNIPAFANNDCTNSFVNTPITCRAAFADRFNNVLGVPTLATFSSEAGAAGPPATTAAGGIAVGTVSVGGFVLPADVTPDPGEYSLDYNSGCGMKIHNPRDGLVAIIVSAFGEEGFVDGSNGCPSDGVYNPPGATGCVLGEFYVDKGEPFVDKNDNGSRDANEPYVDANTDNQWNGPNGQWDQNTVVWAETRVIYTSPARTAAGLSQWYDMTGASPPPPVAVPAPFTVALGPPATSQSLRVYFTDLNFNQLAVSTTYTVVPIPSGPTTTFTTSPAAPLDSLGLTFTQQFCSSPAGGTCSSACQAAPCYTVSRVQGYSYGNYGVVQITAGGTAGSYEVRAAATNNGVAVPISHFGTVLAPPPPP